MLKYKFYTRADRNNALVLRLSNNRKKVEMLTGLQWSEPELENAMSDEPLPENVGKKRWLMRRMSLLDKLKLDLLDEGQGDIDVKDIKSRVQDILNLRIRAQEEKPKQDPKAVTFISHYRAFVARHDNLRTRQIYEATISRMKAFIKSKKDLKPLEMMTFDDITVDWLSSFDKFMAKTSPKKNARNIHFRNIRAVIKDAFKADLTTVHPFDRFQIKPEPTRKRAFPVDTLRKLFSIEVETKNQKYLDFTRLTFMLMGINVIDLCHCPSLVDGRLDYVRAKTHKPLSVKVEPEAMEIINRYKGTKCLLSMVENYDNYRHFYNNLIKALKDIKDKLGVAELTTYWMRHTWATIAASLDIPKETIAHALSQGNSTVTDIYIDYDMKKVDEANRKVLDYVLYGKTHEPKVEPKEEPKKPKEEPKKES